MIVPGSFVTSPCRPTEPVSWQWDGVSHRIAATLEIGLELPRVQAITVVRGRVGTRRRVRRHYGVRQTSCSRRSIRPAITSNVRSMGSASARSTPAPLSKLSG